MQDLDLQQEDTVSADRKVRIVFDPDAWNKKDKSGRKITSVTSRQNFNNAKYGNRSNGDEDDQVKESIQPNGSTQIETGAPTQSDTISKDKPAKSNSPQIKFVTGTAVSAASTATGNAQMNGVKKISEAIVKKALTQVKVDKNVGTEEIPFDGPYTKTPDTVVDKSNSKHTPYSRVRHLARQAMNKQAVKEETEQLDEISTSTLDKAWHGRFQQALAAKHGSPEHQKAHKSMGKISDVMGKRISDKLMHMAKHDPESYKKSAQQVADDNTKRGWSNESYELQEGKMGQIHADIEDHLGKHLADYKANGGAEHFGNQVLKTHEHIAKLHGLEKKHAASLVNQYVDSHLKEEVELAEKLNMAKTDMGDVITDFQQSDAPQFKGKTKEKRREMAIAAKMQADRVNNEETDMSDKLTYAQFVEQLLEYTPGPGGVTRVQGRSYGAQYHDPEGDDDADDKASKPAEAPKRGRGRPKGATSGANHKVTSGKKGSGVDYTGFKLHLPNSNR